MKSLKRGSRRCAVLVTVTLLGSLGAAPAWSDQWTGALTPTSASAQSDSGAEIIYVTTSDTVVNPANCVAADGYVVNNAAITKSSLAIAITAITAGRPVRLYLSSTQCAQNRPMVLDFTLL
jgi:hypothetical protein